MGHMQDSKCYRVLSKLGFSITREVIMNIVDLSTDRSIEVHDMLAPQEQESLIVRGNVFTCVYLTLCFAPAASAVGAYLHILLNIGGIPTTLACVGCISWVFLTPSYQERKRLGLLMGAAAFEGASIGPLIELAIQIDPSLLGCGIVFGCFSGAALYARRREFLYLGALLSSGIYCSCIFVGYIVYDTQEIIERAHLGDLDYVKHALTLFTDFVNVFVRILILMLKNSAEKEEEKKKRRN